MSSKNDEKYLKVKKELSNLIEDFENMRESIGIIQYCLYSSSELDKKSIERIRKALGVLKDYLLFKGANVRLIEELVDEMKESGQKSVKKQ